ncbi:Acetyl-CoA:oxalate CoA-transferase [compost metagenome]
MTGVLTGLRVVELAGLGPAPFAAMMLADHGAEVLRVHPLKPRPGIPSIDTPADVLARGRRSVAVDLKRPEGRELVLDLVAGADALIEGFRPGVTERLGLGPETCLARNPRLAYGRMTGWGQDGPLSARAGHDLNYISLSGVLDAIGTAERPVVPINLVGDFGGGGMLMAFGLLAAVLNARTTGQGQVVDAAMSDGSALLSAMMHGFRAAGAWSNARESNLLDGGAYYYTTYCCADGRFVAVAAIEPQFHSALLQGLGLQTDEFDQADKTRWPEFRAHLARVFAGQPRDYWAALFAVSDACVTPILDWDEASEHPHNRARETFIKVAGINQPAPAPRFSATPASIPTPPVLPDGPVMETLATWGISSARVESLGANGVLGRWKNP